MRGNTQRRIIAAWFGLIALALQVELPLLVAIEISFANRAAANSAFEICGYGPKAERTHEISHHPPRDRDGLCPICIALHAGPAFTATATVAPPLPAARAIAVSAPEMRPAPHLIVLGAYRSRAPPIA